MTTVENKSTVTLHYTGKLADGTVFDSSEGRDPLQFVVGSGQVIKGFDAAVLGMQQGEEKNFVIQPEDAYGQKRDELIQKVPKEKLPKNTDFIKGQSMHVRDQQGRTFPVTIEDVADDTVTINFNHPLAGQALHFTIRIVSVTERQQNN